MPARLPRSLTPAARHLGTVAAILMGCSGLAAAQTTTFKFATSEAPQQIYERFEKTARKACLDHVRRKGPMPLGRMQKQRLICEADLLDQAVAETQLPELAALHAGDDSAREGRLLARRTGTSSE